MTRILGWLETRACWQFCVVIWCLCTQCRCATRCRSLYFIVFLCLALSPVARSPDLDRDDESTRGWGLGVGVSHSAAFVFELLE